MTKKCKNMIADRRLWLNADRSKVVEEGSPEAATLYATPGTVILGEAVKRFKIKALKKTKVENKAVEPDQNKGGLTVKAESKRGDVAPVAKAGK